MEKLIFLFGHPVAHSLSPAMHNTAMEACGLTARYQLLDVTSERLVDALGVLRAENALGCNITIPHKERALTVVDKLTPVAQAMGAINTIYKENGLLVGTNTDGAGFLRALRRQANFEVQGRSCIILGAGGAARACCWSLLQAGAREVTILNRSLSRGFDLARSLQEQYPDAIVRADALVEEKLVGYAMQSQLLVNATSVGMCSGDSPWPGHVLIPAHLVVNDLVYRPIETRLLRQARSHGARAIGGLGMLLHQGAEAFRLWFGIEPPLQLMEDALLDRFGH